MPGSGNNRSSRPVNENTPRQTPLRRRQEFSPDQLQDVDKMRNDPQYNLRDGEDSTRGYYSQSHILDSDMTPNNDNDGSIQDGRRGLSGLVPGPGLSPQMATPGSDLSFSARVESGQQAGSQYRSSPSGSLVDGPSPSVYYHSQRSQSSSWPYQSEPNHAELPRTRSPIPDRPPRSGSRPSLSSSRPPRSESNHPVPPQSEPHHSQPAESGSRPEGSKSQSSGGRTSPFPDPLRSHPVVPDSDRHHSQPSESGSRPEGPKSQSSGGRRQWPYPNHPNPLGSNPTVPDE
ncbi:hypothetical protein F5Y17DRAFT_473810 [Xylariaceae sp. FL0594]|nr:hypothetical protein F5Y17DRAFT_473810 [Xylariaceae sp. FL0594]